MIILLTIELLIQIFLPSKTLHAKHWEFSLTSIAYLASSRNPILVPTPERMVLLGSPKFPSINTHHRRYEKLSEGIYTFYDPSHKGEHTIKADIIFLHGLRGGAFKTWRLPQSNKDTNDIQKYLEDFDLEIPQVSIDLVDDQINGKIQQQSQSPKNEVKSKKVSHWPEELLPLDFPNSRIIVVDYASNVFRKATAIMQNRTQSFIDSSQFSSNYRRKKKPNRKNFMIPHLSQQGKFSPTSYSKDQKALWDMGIDDMTQIILYQLRDAGIGKDERSLIFVTHSLGGLIAKSLVVTDQLIRNLTKGFIFFGVPHHGSSINYPKWMRPLMSRTALELADETILLKNMHSEFLKIAKDIGIKCISFVESKKLSFFLKLIRFKSVIVNLESGNPNIGDVIQVGGVDHIDICKPLSRTGDVRYESIYLFLKSLI